jgi:hypothetical protein
MAVQRLPLETMRHFEFTLTPEDGAIHRADRLLAQHPGMTREALSHVDALADGTGVMLHRLRGGGVVWPTH